MIPDSVTNIGMSAFESCWALTNLTVGNGVKTIRSSAFGHCGSLTSVTIPDNVVRLEGGVFEVCSNLTAATIGNGVTRLGDQQLFSQCTNLSSVKIGQAVTNIPNTTFFLCINLTNLTMPRGLSIIGSGAFTGCSNLTALFFQGNPPMVPYPNIFLAASNVVIYYLPGTTGWSPTFVNRPTALWNPQVQTSDTAFGPSGSGFGLPITGTANIPIVLEASADISADSWVPLHSCTLTNGSLYFCDTEWMNYPARFYRIRSP